MDSDQFIDFAAMELEKIGLINRTDMIDGTLVRVQGIPCVLWRVSRVRQGTR
jgi:hypothetical protein